MSKKMPPLPWTDSIRGLSCIVVIIWHAYLTITPDDPTPGQQRFSLPLGVAARESLVLFILLSGYLLGRHWADGFARDGLWPKFKLYVYRRTWRIVPSFWAAVTLTILAMLLLGLDKPEGSHWDEGLPLTWLRAMANYLMITDFWDQVPLAHPHWTVPLEYHLYFLAPLIVLVRRQWIAMGLAVAVCLVAVFVLKGYHAPYFPFVFVISFWAGVNRQKDKGKTLSSTLRATWPGSVVSVGLLLLIVTVGSNAMDVSTRNYFLADCLVGAVVLPWMYWTDVANRRTAFVRLLTFRGFRWLGDRSYSIYLVHAVVLECFWRFVVRPMDIKGETPDFILLMVLAVFGSILVGMVLFRWVELPTARKSASIGRSTHKTTDGTAVSTT